MSLLQSLLDYFTKSTQLPLEIAGDGLPKTQDVRQAIETYAQKQGQILRYQKHDMPNLQFTLDDTPYIVRRGWGRGGPTVVAVLDKKRKN